MPQQKQEGKKVGWPLTAGRAYSLVPARSPVQGSSGFLSKTL